MGLFDQFKKRSHEKNPHKREAPDIKAAVSQSEYEHAVGDAAPTLKPMPESGYVPQKPAAPEPTQPAREAPAAMPATRVPASSPVKPIPADNLQWENVYIFISSTFNDMHAERDYLVKRVFPELSEWCESRRLHLVDIDLRWGVTEADSEKNKRVVEVCLTNIDKCRPFFLCFLGQRRGWVPCGEDISEGTFCSFSKLKKYLGASVTEMEIIHALVDPMLNGSIEDLRKQERAFFFLRDANYLNDITDQAVRNIYTNEGEADPNAADQALARFKDEVVGKSGRPVYFYFTHWNKESSTPELAVAGTSANANSRPEITKGRLTDFACNGAPLADAVLAVLKQAIDERYPGRNMPAQKTSLLQHELDQQAQFRQLAGEGFIPREGDFDEIDRYIQGDERRPFALCASAGLGKTSFLACFIEKLLSRQAVSVVYRFVGVSDDSWSLYRLLTSILQELRAAGKIEASLPVTESDIKNKFSDLLESAGTNEKLVIVIDALNQLESGLDDLTWLPWTLPLNVKLIFSFKLGDEKGDTLARRLARENRAIFGQIRPFETQHDRTNLVTQYLSHYLKELDEYNIETIISSQGAANPLFLKILLSELRVFGSHMSLREIIRNRFGQTPLSAFDAVLDRIESDPAYSAIEPAVLSAHVFGWLTHSKNGLSADELTQLLLKANISGSRQAAYDAVQLLLRQLRPYLAKRDGRIDFFYESFFLAARKRYTTAHALAKPDAEWHRELAEYFESLPPYAPRSLSEIAYQYAHAGMAEELCSILLDYRFIESRMQKADVAAVIEDFSYAQLSVSMMGNEDKTGMALIGDALSLASSTLAKSAAQLPTQLFGRLLEFDLPQIRRLLDDTVRCLREENRPWLRPKSPCMPAPGGALMRTYRPVANGISAFRDRERTLVSNKTDGSVKLVEIKTGKVIRNYPLDAMPGARYMNDFILLEDENTFAIRMSGALCLVDIDTAKARRVPGFTGSPKRRMYAKGNLLLSYDKARDEQSFRLNVVDVRAGEIIHTFADGVQNTSMGFAFNADTSLLLIGTDDNKVSVFDVKNDFALLYRIGTHPKHVTDICLLEDRGLLITKAADNRLYVWRMEDEKLMLETYAGFLETFLISHDRQTLAVGNFGKLEFYSLKDFVKTRSIGTGNGKAVALLFSNDDGRLFVGRDSGLVECWDIVADTLLATYQEHTASADTLFLSSDETCLVSGGLVSGVCVWDLNSPRDIKRDEGVRALRVVSADLSADDSFLLSIDDKGRVQRIETSTMKISDICSINGASVPEICISRDCRHFAVRNKLNEMKVFKTDTGELVGAFDALNPYGNPDMAQIWNPAFLAPEACLSDRCVTIVSHQGGKIIVQDIDKQDSPMIIDAFEGRISWFKVFEGGRKLLVFSTGNEACPLAQLNQKQGFESGAKIYDTATWKCFMHTGDHLAAYFSAIETGKFGVIENYVRSSYSYINMKDFIPLVDFLYRDKKHAVYLRKQFADDAFPFWDTQDNHEVTVFRVEGNIHERLFTQDGRNIFLFGYGKTLYPLYFENPPF